MMLTNHQVKRKLKLNHFGGLCGYCGNCSATQLDHIHPESKGGNKKITNVMPACGKCNRLKQNLSIEEFRQFISKQAKQYKHHTKKFYHNNMPIYHIIDSFKAFDKHSNQFYFERNPSNTPIPWHDYLTILMGDTGLKNSQQQRESDYIKVVNCFNNKDNSN